MLDDFWGDVGGDELHDDFVGLTSGAAALVGEREDTPIASGSGLKPPISGSKKIVPKKIGPTLKKKPAADPFVSDSDGEVEVVSGDTKGKGRAAPASEAQTQTSQSTKDKSTPAPTTQTTLPFAPPPAPKAGPVSGNIVRDEVKVRRAEAMGMAPGGRTLGGPSDGKTLGDKDGNDRMPDRAARLAALDRLQKAAPTRPVVKKNLTASSVPAPAPPPSRRKSSDFF
ncbi:hypothetical protein PENSPDRAFT_379666 [Peniophora sp. CONT]|nr:hypothetical protein PENSPDRAFT_379666 [Peniophora sp. CONT]